MRLLIPGGTNDLDGDWGQYLVVELDENALASIRRRCAAFAWAAATDPSLVEMAWCAPVTVYGGALVFERRDDDGRSASVEADALFVSGENAAVIPPDHEAATDASDVGYACMQIGSIGVFWEAGAPEGPCETQTFPIPLAELEALYQRAQSLQ